MQLLVRSHRTHVLALDQSSAVTDLMDAIEGRTGIPPAAQILLYEGRQLSAELSLARAGVTEGSTVRLSSRLLGGGEQPISIVVRPRVQRERWSLYWKETMATQTALLDDITLNVDPATTTGRDLLRAIAQAVGWQDVSELLSLEGFDGPWERLLLAGRELESSKSLAEQGVTSGASLVAVRLSLAAEGWKIQDDEDDDSSDEEEEEWVQSHPHQEVPVSGHV